MKSVLDYISSHSWMGMPLDVLAHFFLGALAYVVLAQVLRSRLAAFAMVLILAVAKEFTLDFDTWTTYGFYLEPAKDILISVLAPGLWLAASANPLETT